MRPKHGLGRRMAALGAGVALSLAAAAPASAALVGHWPLDALENGNTTTPDVSGTGLGMTAAGPLTGIAGRLGSGLDFATSVVLKAPPSPALEPATTLTLSAWVKKTATSMGNYAVAKGASTCFAASYALNGGGRTFYVWTDNGFVYSPGAPAAISDGNWHHVVGTYDGSKVRYYFDGTQVGNGTVQTGPIRYGLPDNDLRIGTYAGCSLPFTGGIDDVRIYSHVLSDAEIAELATAGTPGTSSPPPPSGPPAVSPAGGTRPSATALLCNRGPKPTDSSQCFATVGDAGGQPRITPSGTVTWTATKGSFTGTTCDLVPTPNSQGVASCSATYLPDAGGSPAGVALPVSARYGGDGTFAPSGAGHNVITAGCIGTPAKPCPGTVADAFGFTPSMTLSTTGTLAVLRAIAACGAAGQQAKGLASAVTAICKAGVSVNALPPDVVKGVADALRGSAARQGEAVSTLRAAFSLLELNGGRDQTPCGGGFAAAVAKCASLLNSIDAPGGALGATLKRAMTYADVAGLSDVMAQALRDAGGSRTDAQVRSLVQRVVGDAAAQRNACRATPIGSYLNGAFNCGQVAKARKARTWPLATGTGAVPLGETAAIPLRFTPRAQLLSALLKDLGAKNIRVSVRLTVTQGDTKARPVTKKIVVALR